MQNGHMQHIRRMEGEEFYCKGLGLIQHVRNRMLMITIYYRWQPAAGRHRACSPAGEARLAVLVAGQRGAAEVHGVALLVHDALHAAALVHLVVRQRRARRAAGMRAAARLGSRFLGARRACRGGANQKTPPRVLRGMPRTQHRAQGGLL
jgi:hypothetical protein